MYRVSLEDGGQRRTFMLRGKATALADLLTLLEGQGATVALSGGDAHDQAVLPTMIAADGLGDLPDSMDCACFVWPRQDRPEWAGLAQERGALCVLPRQFSPAALGRVLDHALVLAATRASGELRGSKRHFQRGEQVHLEEDRVVRILRGVVRCTSVHPDGSEVLIGFYGEGDVLMAHASVSCQSHSCFVEMRAHTNLAVVVEPWALAVQQADFHDRLKRRICQMELWCSMQARSSIEERLLGILQVIGGRFSHTLKEGGAMLFICVTHEQLASAVGATRTTVTRLLQSLRKRGLLHLAKTEKGSFFVLDQHVAHCHHE